MQVRRALGWMVVLAAWCGGAVWAQTPAWNANADGVVLGGYDVVAYHTEDRAVLGRADLSVTHQGGRFLFASAENRTAFEKEPARYAPAFGGFCAYGVAANKVKAPVEPHTFEIYNGHLLLFFNDLYQGQPVNTKVLWNQDEAELFAAAEKIWPTLR